MLVDISKKYKTECGNSVRILATDLTSDNDFCVVAAVKGMISDIEIVHYYTIDGKYSLSGEKSLFDLVEI